MGVFLSQTDIWFFSIKVLHLWLTYNLFAKKIGFYQVAKSFLQKEKPEYFNSLLNIWNFLLSKFIQTLLSKWTEDINSPEGNGQGGALCGVIIEFRNHSGVAEILEIKEKTRDKPVMHPNLPTGTSISFLKLLGQVTQASVGPHHSPSLVMFAQGTEAGWGHKPENRSWEPGKKLKVCHGNSAEMEKNAVEFQRKWVSDPKPVMFHHSWWKKSKEFWSGLSQKKKNGCLQAFSVQLFIDETIIVKLYI